MRLFTFLVKTALRAINGASKLHIFNRMVGGKKKMWRLFTIISKTCKEESSHLFCHAIEFK